MLNAHTSIALQRRRNLERCAAIKRHYLCCGHSEQEWQAVMQDVSQFNAAWCAMLGLPSNGKPPPEAYRR